MLAEVGADAFRNWMGRGDDQSASVFFFFFSGWFVWPLEGKHGKPKSQKSNKSVQISDGNVEMQLEIYQILTCQSVDHLCEVVRAH